MSALKLKAAYNLKASVLARALEGNLGENMGTGNFPTVTPHKGRNIAVDSVGTTSNSRQAADLVYHEFASATDEPIGFADKPKNLK
jgi:hypothetical protein